MTHSRLSESSTRAISGVGRIEVGVAIAFGVSVVAVFGARADNIRSPTGLPVASTARNTAVIAHTLMMSGRPKIAVEFVCTACAVVRSRAPLQTLLQCSQDTAAVKANNRLNDLYNVRRKAAVAPLKVEAADWSILVVCVCEVYTPRSKGR